MKIAGLDIGSTGCKLTVFDSDGSCLGKAYRDYPVKRTKTAHEVEAQDIIDSVFEVMEEMGRRSAQILLGMIRGHGAHCCEVLPTQLREGRSVKSL